eukprot:CAMPEP_0194285412 /NCGR_PEP_ID=MMETSP0169-20130528/30119_1 /TAXON_ID=218684 /ORGANISM="Corethron pennatum, Strain L29A3" /LENGTH=56 /DNA_ID=CAMNT_0039031523 /DNA_START=55 /DNA_END=222 /DNA_ORIENTATION=-
MAALTIPRYSTLRRRAWLSCVFSSRVTSRDNGHSGLLFRTGSLRLSAILRMPGGDF